MPTPKNLLSTEQPQQQQQGETEEQEQEQEEKPLQLCEEKKASLEKMFSSYDFNNDGALQKSEMLAMLVAYFPAADAGEMTNFVREADVNGDGEVDMKEFIRFCETHHIDPEYSGGGMDDEDFEEEEEQEHHHHHEQKHHQDQKDEGEQTEPFLENRKEEEEEVPKVSEKKDEKVEELPELTVLPKLQPKEKTFCGCC